MRMRVEKTSGSDAANNLDAGLSRRSFLKSAAAAAVLGTATPQVLMVNASAGLAG